MPPAYFAHLSTQSLTKADWYENDPFGQDWTHNNEEFRPKWLAWQLIEGPQTFVALFA